MGPAMGQGYGTAVPAGQPLVGRITVGLQHPGKAVVCVKFSNLIVVLGDASGEPPVSVAAVTARWVDCLQLLEVELGNGLELLRQPRPFETGRQVVQPSAVFVPQVDQRRYRRRPALGPRWGASRLAFGWGHWYGAD